MSAKKRDPAANIRRFFAHLHHFKELKRIKPLTEEQIVAARNAVQCFAKEQREKAETIATLAGSDATEFGDGVEGQAAKKIAERYAAKAADFKREKKIAELEQHYLQAMEADNIKDAMLSWKPTPEEVSANGSCSMHGSDPPPPAPSPPASESENNRNFEIRTLSHTTSYSKASVISVGTAGSSDRYRGDSLLVEQPLYHTCPAKSSRLEGAHTARSRGGHGMPAKRMRRRLQHIICESDGSAHQGPFRARREASLPLREEQVPTEL